MERGLRGITMTAVLVLLAGTARAQSVPDNLQCYKVRDADLRGLHGVVDLDAPSLGVAPGCKIGKAKLYCAPAKQQVRPGTLFNGNASVTELPYHGPPAETDRICYRVTCPKPSGTAADQTVTDRFGTRRLTGLKSDMVCTPATGGTLPPPASGFQIKSPEIEIQPGQNVPYCYYFRFPNTTPVAVKRWVSSMRAVNRQVILFTTTTQQGAPMDTFPPGTVSAVDCSVLGHSGAFAHWVYEAHTQNAELAMPVDDGAGNPLAMEIPAFSSGFLLLHHVNSSSEVQKGQVTINAEALDSPVYTRTDTFTASNSTINVPQFTASKVESETCDVPPGASFWHLTTHSHKFATRSNVLEGLNVIFETLDWADPGAATWPAPPFRSFASNKLTYGCTYQNPFGFTLRTGGSYQSEEQCLAVGYFFPATKPVSCLDGFGPY